MVSEEMGLNHVLEADGVEVVETDLGEYIVQLAGEAPYHIIAPAIHKTKEQVADLLAEESGAERQETAEQLTRQAREMLRGVFQRADMSITGANFAVAETGSIVLVTNEGNGRMATSMPRIHVAAMGMEKLVPSAADLSAMLRILIRSATGQRISCYVTMVNGPRAHDEEDGPEEFHLVIMNNGRDRLLRDESLREALNCIRCGACMNSCPVYRKVGGHSYGWVYPGPIGSIVSPVLTGLKDGAKLPAASSLCGACHDACPVKINIPRMLLELRSQTARRRARSRATSVRDGRAAYLESVAAWNDESPSFRSRIECRKDREFAVGKGWLVEKGAASDLRLDRQPRFPRSGKPIVWQMVRGTPEIVNGQKRLHIQRQRFAWSDADSGGSQVRLRFVTRICRSEGRGGRCATRG